MQTKAVFEQRLATHGGVTYSFSVANEQAAKKILFVHGVSGMKEDMEPMGHHTIKQGYATYLLDLPNHGKGSRVPVESFEDMGRWLRDAIAAIGIVPDVIIGHSYGSAVCYTYASLGFLPDHTRLILGCPTPTLSFMTLLLGRVLIRLPRPWINPTYDSRPMIAARVNYLSKRPGVPKQLLRGSELRKIGAMDVFTVTKMGHLMHTHNPYKDKTLSESVQRRTTVIIGDLDNVVTPQSVERLRQLLPCAAFDIIEGAGHILHFEAPEQVVRHVGARRE